MGKHVECRVCGGNADPVPIHDLGHAAIVLRCEGSCGGYALTPAAAEFLGKPENNRIRGQLRGVLYYFHVRNQERSFPLLDERDIRPTLAAHGVPTDHSARIDAVLQEVARLAPDYGQWTDEETLYWWMARLFSSEPRVAANLLNDYADLLDCEGSIPTDVAVAARFRLTRAGWQHLSTLRNAGQAADTLFLANWAHPLVASEVEAATSAAARALGLGLRVGNRLAPPDTRIDDAVVAAIRAARVIVADLTGDRGGVYYEVGFAHGLGKHVVLTCHDSWQCFAIPRAAEVHDAASTDAPTLERRLWFDRVHFDLNHFWFARWRSVQDLEKAIVDSVRARGLAAPGHS